MKKFTRVFFPCMTYLAIVGVSYISGMYYKELSFKVKNSRTPQSTFLSEKFEDVPCLSEDEYTALKRKYNISGDPPKFNPNDPNDLCSKKSNRAILAKSFTFLEQLKIDKLPEDWRWGAREALTNPSSFFSKSTPNVFYDFTRQTSTAYNVSRNNHIALCTPFFRGTDMVKKARLLIHEARHSSVDDPGHSECRQGDVSFASGGCDDWFRTDKNQGSYAYADVSYRYGLVKFSNLSKKVKAKMQTTALWYLAHRFNKVPEFLGTHTDSIYILDQDHEIQILHPFLNKLVKYKRQFGGDVISMHYSPRLGVVGEYENENPKVLKPLSTGKPYRIHNKVLSEKFNVKHLNYLYYSNKRKTYFITDKNTINYIELSSKKGIYEAKKSSYQISEGEVLRKLFSAKNRNRYALAESGKLYFFKSEGDQRFLQESVFQSPDEGWKDSTHGVLFKHIYGISQAGELYYWSNSSQVKPSTFKIESPMIKFQENISLRASLGEDNHLYVKKYGINQKVESTSLSHFGVLALDFSIVTKSLMLKFDYEQNEFFNRSCGIVKSIYEPWTDRHVGISELGELIFEGNVDDPCWKVNNNKFGGIKDNSKVSDIRFKVLSREREFSFGYGGLVLEVEYEDGDKVNLFPYSQKLD